MNPARYPGVPGYLMEAMYEPDPSLEYLMQVVRRLEQERNPLRVLRDYVSGLRDHRTNLQLFVKLCNAMLVMILQQGSFFRFGDEEERDRQESYKLWVLLFNTLDPQTMEPLPKVQRRKIKDGLLFIPRCWRWNLVFVANPKNQNWRAWQKVMNERGFNGRTTEELRKTIADARTTRHPEWGDLMEQGGVHVLPPDQWVGPLPPNLLQEEEDDAVPMEVDEEAKKKAEQQLANPQVRAEIQQKVVEQMRAEQAAMENGAEQPPKRVKRVKNALPAVNTAQLEHEAAAKDEVRKALAAATNKQETVDTAALVTSNKHDKQNEAVLEALTQPATEEEEAKQMAEGSDMVVQVTVNPAVPATAPVVAAAALMTPTPQEVEDLHQKDKEAAEIQRLNGVQEARPAEIDLSKAVPPEGKDFAPPGQGAKGKRVLTWVNEVIQQIYNTPGFVHDRADYVDDLRRAHAAQAAERAERAKSAGFVEVRTRTANGEICQKIPASKARTLKLILYFVQRLPNADLIKLGKMLYNRLRDGGSGARDAQSVYTDLRAFMLNNLSVGPIDSRFITPTSELSTEGPYIEADEAYQRIMHSGARQEKLQARREYHNPKSPYFFNVHEHGFGKF